MTLMRSTFAAAMIGPGRVVTTPEGAFGVTFPLTAKYEVKGAGAHPFYRWAVGALGSAATPQWNFHKVLVGRDGRAVASYPSSTEPLSSTLTKAVEQALAHKP